MTDVDFERGMIRLTAVVGGRLERVTAAFKLWVASTPFPWPFALDYCIKRACAGKSLPFEV